MSSFVPPVYMNDMDDDDDNVQNYGSNHHSDISQYQSADTDSVCFSHEQYIYYPFL